MLGYIAIVNAQLNGGYAIPGEAGGSSCPDRVQQVVDVDPAVVVLACGMADAQRGVPAATVSEAVRLSITQVKKLLPKAKIIVVGPFWPSLTTTTALEAVRRAVMKSAGEARVTFIDPVKERWLAIGEQANGTGNILVLPNRNLLSQAGHREYAKRFTGDVMGQIPTFQPR